MTKKLISIELYHKYLNQNTVLLVSEKQQFLVPFRRLINQQNSPWVLVKNLKAGEHILKYASNNCTDKNFSFAKIKSIKKITLKKPEKIISLSIKNNKNYCVSNVEILAHNINPTLSLAALGITSSEFLLAAEMATGGEIVANTLGYTIISGWGLPIAGCIGAGIAGKMIYDHYYNDANSEIPVLPILDDKVLPSELKNESNLNLDNLNFIEIEKSGKISLSNESKFTTALRTLLPTTTNLFLGGRKSFCWPTGYT